VPTVARPGEILGGQRRFCGRFGGKHLEPLSSLIVEQIHALGLGGLESRHNRSAAWTATIARPRRGTCCAPTFSS
jgi:hypothetical protein